MASDILNTKITTLGLTN